LRFPRIHRKFITFVRRV